MFVIDLFIFSISSWFSFGRLCFSRTLSISSRLSFYWHIVVPSSLLWSFVFLCCLCRNFSFFISNFYWFESSTFFPWRVWLMVCQFCLSSQRTSFSFIGLCYSFRSTVLTTRPPGKSSYWFLSEPFEIKSNTASLSVLVFPFQNHSIKIKIGKFNFAISHYLIYSPYSNVLCHPPTPTSELAIIFIHYPVPRRPALSPRQSESGL